MTVPCGRWTRPGPVAEVGLLLGGGRGGARRVGELVDDDEALASGPWAGGPGRRRAARRRGAAPRPGGPRPGCRPGRGSASPRAATSSARVWLTAGVTVIAGPDARAAAGRADRMSDVAQPAATTHERDRRGSEPDPRRRPCRPHPGGQSNGAPAHQVDVEVVDRLAAPATRRSRRAGSRRRRCPPPGPGRRRPRTAARASARRRRSAPPPRRCGGAASAGCGSARAARCRGWR